jgi:hypothetical protein
MWREFVFVYRCCGSKDDLLSITPYLSGGDQGAEKGSGELRWADPEVERLRAITRNGDHAGPCDPT